MNLDPTKLQWTGKEPWRDADQHTSTSITAYEGDVVTVSAAKAEELLARDSHWKPWKPKSSAALAGGVPGDEGGAASSGTAMHTGAAKSDRPRPTVKKGSR